MHLNNIIFMFKSKIPVMSALWNQFALTELAELVVIYVYIKWWEEQRLVQFLMTLRFDFEPLQMKFFHFH